MGVLKQVKEKAKSIFNKVKGGVKKVFEGLSLPKVPKEHRDELLVANEAYNPPDNRKPTIMGFTYDRGLSSLRHAVYVSRSERRINFGLRGTVPTNIRDLGSDVRIAQTDTLGTDKGAFKGSVYMEEVRETLGRIRKKYPGYKITVVGHSLAGRASIQVAKENKNVPSITFNAGGGNFTKNQIPGGSIHYRAPTDPISAGFRPDKRTIQIVDESKPKGANHSLSYFM